MKKKILFGLAGIAFCTLLMLNISVVFEGTSTGFTLQNTIASATEGEGGGGTKIIVSTDTNVVTTSYTQSEGCPSGQHKNCIRTTGTHTITCLPSGNQYCTPSVSEFDDTYCGNCTN